MPAVDSVSLWKENLEKMKEEVLEAERVQAPNAKFLRMELMARQSSYLRTNISNTLKSTEPYVIPTRLPNIDESVSNLANEMAYRAGEYIRTLVEATYTGVPAAGIMIPVTHKREIEFLSPSGTVMDEQKFIQRIGMQSNCNVSVQTKKLGLYGGGFSSGGLGNAYRLRCDQCQESQNIDDPKLIEHHKYDHPIIADFCKIHQHLTGASSSSTIEGRKFRD